MTDIIKWLCKQTGISITKLEREVGLGRSTIRFWDNSPPSIDKVAKVAQYFNVSLDYLYRNINEPQSHQARLKEAVEALEKIQSITCETIAKFGQPEETDDE